MFVHKATLEDLEPVSVLFEAYRLFYRMNPDFPQAKEFVRARLLNNDAEIFVCSNEENAIVGFVQLYSLFSSTRMRRLWLLNDLFVDPACRGKGYSIMLINKAKELCRETNACGLILETAKDNDIGNKLYEQTGFVVDREHNYYSWESSETPIATYDKS